MSNRERARIVARGAVQGVGFRPFIHRLATGLGLYGYVLNSGGGVLIEIEGEPDRLRRFLSRFEKEKPPRAILQSFETSLLDAIGYKEFEIRESDDAGAKTALILPDIATCADCLREIFDPHNRRSRYPFTNCTNCGPRFSIIEALPYDRANTSMKRFVMCADCAHEYRDPGDRRFHAEPTACPRCGPRLQLWDSSGKTLNEAERALEKAAATIRAGKIVALKGLGGFQLLADARNDEAVTRLRERKRREEKPFAVMFPSLEAARRECEIDDLEERLLVSPECPIVLLKKIGNGKSQIANEIAPRNPNLGVMLPYSPLHHLLLRELNLPVVATSGNLSDEPICIDENEALERLNGLADFFLVHDRPIVRHVDDSIVRIVAGREMILRRARGYAPLPINQKSEIRNQKSVLAVGAHLKNTVALSVGKNTFVSQHIGDLQTKEAYAAFCAAAADLPRLYETKPEVIAHDLHPEYLSTKFAAQFAADQTQLSLHPVQHHFAHVLSCMAENEVEPPLLGVAWDGTGFGPDETIWGGEFLRVAHGGFERVAHLRTFPLPGGDAAVKEPRRSALGLLYEMLGEDAWSDPAVTSLFSKAERAALRIMLKKKINTPRTSSIGRLFDAVSALLGLRTRASFEGQGAMELEFAAGSGIAEAYEIEIRGEGPMILDWTPMISALAHERQRDQPLEIVAAKFHNALVNLIAAVARGVGEKKVVLTGGCFQNRYLLERSVELLRTAGFRPYWHQRIPPNDGGISLGQVASVGWKTRRNGKELSG